MEDTFNLNSSQNLFRQAIFDLANNDRWTLIGIIDWQLDEGRSVKRLAKFASRRLKIDEDTAMIALVSLVPYRFH